MPETQTPATLHITRTFNAPRSLVYKACTEAERLAKWWGPAGFTMKVAKLDVRPGGAFHYCMSNPQGMEMWGRFDYLGVKPEEELEFLNCFSNAEGGDERNPFMASWPLHVHNVWTLTEEGGKTTLAMVGKPHNASDEENALFAANTANVQGGFKGTFDQLDAYLAEAQK